VRRAVIAATLAAGISAFGAGPAVADDHGHTLKVDDDHAQCPDAQYSSIQAAVTAAQPNDTIVVCPGTYTEQVKIQTHQKDGLKLVSQKPQQAIIQSPAVQTSPKAIVLIEGADRVSLVAFTVKGPFVEPGCGSPIPGSDPSNPVIDVHKGVYVKNGFRETILGNRITQIQNSNPALFGCQDGIAVQIGRKAESAQGSAFVGANVIDDYQKGGVIVDNSGSSGAIAGNVIRAATAVQPNIAPNGVQISRGAGAELAYNKVSRNKYLGDPSNGSGSGILLFQPGAGKVDVNNNESFDNDDGLPLIDSDKERIRENYSHDNVLYDGLFADTDSTQNLFKENVALRNTEHDCHDDSHGNGTAGTANYWKDDTGVTQTPEGICKPPRSHDGDDGHGHGGGGHSRLQQHKAAPTDAGQAGDATALTQLSLK
jgi:hypothetical protein